MGKIKRTTLSDVADRACVSQSTVSRVINDVETVHEEIRERILSAISELDYVVDKRRRRLKKSNLVGIIIPNIRNPFFSEIICGIESVAKIHNYHIILCDSEENVEIETNNITSLIKNKVDGIMLAACTGRNPIFDEIHKAKIPLVCFDRQAKIEDLCIVESDNEEGAYQATKYLLNLGHRQIVFVAGPKDQTTIRQRRKGYEKALEEYSLSVNDRLIVKSDGLIDNTFNQFKRFLSDGVSFSAVFAGNDMMAFGVMKVLSESGLQVPEDVALIGYDDILFSSFISLTTVAQPMFDIGKNTMIMLIDLMSGRVQPPQRMVLHSRMVIRDSCHCLADKRRINNGSNRHTRNQDKPGCNARSLG